ncbi:hypothetical protein PDIDSM_1167 [Penicillium digitatum]|nr:hypothetical protein PDIDSM_1167 [Penicillium digitatum]
MLFFSFFKTLTNQTVTIELKNDIRIRGILKSVDQYLNIKLDDIEVLDLAKYPHLSSVKNMFIRGSVVRYVMLPRSEVDVGLLEDATRREDRHATGRHFSPGADHSICNGDLAFTEQRPGLPTSQRGDNSRYDHAGGLFLEDKKGLANVERAAATSERERSLTPDLGDDEEFLKSDPNRYNERDTAVKRRKLDSLDSPADETRQPDAESKTTKAPTPAPAPAKTKKMSGPFIDESDSENDMEAYRELHETTPVAKDVTNDTLQRDKIVATERTFEPTPLPLVRAATNADDNESTNFDDIEEEDEFVGEEFRNRPWEGRRQVASKSTLW